MRILFRQSSILVLVLTFILSGCASFAPYQIVSQKEIDQWVKNNQYGHALKALRNKVKLFPTRTAKRNLEKIKIKAAHYDRKQADRILKLQSMKEWDKAITILHSSLQKYPDGKQLQRVYKIIRGKQEKQIMHLEAQLLLEKAEWLSETLKIYQNMLLIDPKNHLTKWHINNTQVEIQNIATKLHTLGRNALREKKYDLADICLSTANRLRPNKEHRHSLALLELKSEKTSKEIKLLLDGMKQALENNNLKNGSKLLRRLANVDNYPPEIESLKQSLIKKINDEVGKILKSGSVLYKNGQIEQAKKIWATALKLDPKNEQIHDRISRAERALETLKELKKAESSK